MTNPLCTYFSSRIRPSRCLEMTRELLAYLTSSSADMPRVGVTFVVWQLASYQAVIRQPAPRHLVCQCPGHGGRKPGTVEEHCPCLPPAPQQVNPELAPNHCLKPVPTPALAQFLPFLIALKSRKSSRSLTETGSSKVGARTICSCQTNKIAESETKRAICCRRA